MGENYSVAYLMHFCYVNNSFPYMTKIVEVLCPFKLESGGAYAPYTLTISLPLHTKILALYNYNRFLQL